MPGCYQPGIIAECNYQTVKFFPFNVPPGASLSLTADPWSYLFARISSEIPKTRGENKIRLEKAHYFAELAAGFYRAADSIRFPSKSLVLYYGMLNLILLILLYL